MRKWTCIKCEGLMRKVLHFIHGLSESIFHTFALSKKNLKKGCQSTRHTVNSSQPKIVWRVDQRLKHRVVTSWPAPQTPCCHCCDELTACCCRHSYAATISESKCSSTLFLNDFLLICSLSIRGKQFHRALPEYWTDFILKDFFTYRMSKSLLCLVSWLWTSLLITN